MPQKLPSTRPLPPSQKSKPEADGPTRIEFWTARPVKSRPGNYQYHCVTIFAYPAFVADEIRNMLNAPRGDGSVISCILVGPGIELFGSTIADAAGWGPQKRRTTPSDAST